MFLKSFTVFLPLVVYAASPDFNRDIAPILRTRCFGCHGPAQQMSGLRLDRREDALRGGYSGKVIQPGDSAASRLYALITTGIPREGAKLLMMPPVGARLDATQTELIHRWIDAGAVWPTDTEGLTTQRRPLPWSFQPVRLPAAPNVRHTSLVRNPIDSFILAKLESLGIEPSPEASKNTLVRRVYLDLVGLPPTPEETAAFLGDQRPDAYERLVDRLQASPHYGEKWARLWLDLARYADSEGAFDDWPRPYAWRYRQWVIDALNRDMPFDQFTIEQIAGDLLPGATISQKTATGFHRNTLTSREGGIDLAKLRYDQLVDRTNTLGTTWLGLTVGCAQCHDHKYDPITQRDYYSLMAFYQNAVEKDVEAPTPGELGTYRRTVNQYRGERQKLLEQYDVPRQQKEWEDEIRFAAANPGKHTDWDLSYDDYTKMVDDGPRILNTNPSHRPQREQDVVTDYYVRWAEYGIGKKRYEELKLKELNGKLRALREKYPSLSIVMTLAQDGSQAPTYLRIRGNYRDHGVEVTPNTPAALPPLPAGNPPTRLSLARWLVSRENPLVARVAVNRMWQELFGRGLVNTSADFGMQGEKPTHPELLDWMASQFMDRGWSMKAIERLIVLSSTYRQSSSARSDLSTRDPGNTLLARQSRFRLPAELIRDSTLEASGLFADSVGGESVRPATARGRESAER